MFGEMRDELGLRPASWYNAQLVWMKLKVYYKFKILCTLQSVINIRYNRIRGSSCTGIRIRIRGYANFDIPSISKVYSIVCCEQLAR